MAQDAALPQLTSGEQVRDYAGEVVMVRGRYEQRDVRMAPPGAERPPQFDGHVAIILADGTPVYLYPPSDAEAIRPSEEVAEFDQMTVEVTGLLYPLVPGEGARIMAPCLVDTGPVRAAGPLPTG